MNAMQAMWKASKTAHQKRRLRKLGVEARGELRAQGAFAASAMAMYSRDMSSTEGREESADRPNPAMLGGGSDVVSGVIEVRKRAIP